MSNYIEGLFHLKDVSEETSTFLIKIETRCAKFGIPVGMEGQSCFLHSPSSWMDLASFPLFPPHYPEEV